MAVRHWFALALPVVVAVAACQKEERTEVVVVVDTDYTVPSQLDAVVVEVTDPDGNNLRSTGELVGPGDLPAIVGLVHEEGPLGPYEVVAVGSSAGDSVVSRRAVFSFIARQILTLPMHLVRSCAGETCPTGETCTEDGCADEQVSGLEAWSGSPPRLGGDGDADGDVDGDADGDGDCDAETCNGEDDDCDGEVDEDFDLLTDVENCGECGTVCEVANGTAGCEEGGCTVEGCTPGFDNCNYLVGDGCETDLNTSTEHCGGCTLRCRAGNVCCEGTCAASCE